MKRQWFAVLGGFIAVSLVASLAAFGERVLFDPQFAVVGALFLSSAVLLLLAGTTDAIGGIEWNQFAGAADVLLGLALIVQFLLTATLDGATSASLLADAAAALGGLVLLFIGADWIRGGKHFDLAAYDSGPLFGE